MSFFPPFRFISFFSYSAIVLFNSFFFLFLFSQLLLERLLTCLFSCGCPFQLSSAVCVAQISFISFPGPLLPFTGTEGSHFRPPQNKDKQHIGAIVRQSQPQLSGKHDGYINRNYISHDTIIHLFNMLQLIIW